MEKCDHNKNKLPNCPICIKREAVFNMKKAKLKDYFFGSSPAPFVGRYNYPNINVGILSPQKQDEENWIYDSPKYWAKEKFSIQNIVDLRSQLVNARFVSNVNGVRKREKLIGLSKEVGMASKPVDVEISLKKEPKFAANFDNIMTMTGPKALLQKAVATSNPKIHKKVDKVVDGVDWKATDALKYLYKNNFDENFLSRMLSVGTVGLKHKRKLVPTRWSITAVDDMLGKNILEEIRDYKTKDYEAYFGEHLGNYYIIMFLPHIWSYELFEIHSSGKVNEWSKNGLIYATDYENHEGRKTYVEETAGGYYAPRLAILEKLKKDKRQASVLVLRIITDDYSVPLGVWVTREAARNTLNNKAIGFSSRELMLKYAMIIAKKKFGVNISEILKKSKLLDNIRKQSSLKDFQ